MRDRELGESRERRDRWRQLFDLVLLQDKALQSTKPAHLERDRFERELVWAERSDGELGDLARPAVALGQHGLEIIQLVVAHNVEHLLDGSSCTHVG